MGHCQAQSVTHWPHLASLAPYLHNLRNVDLGAECARLADLVLGGEQTGGQLELGHDWPSAEGATLVGEPQLAPPGGSPQHHDWSPPASSPGSFDSNSSSPASSSPLGCSELEWRSLTSASRRRRRNARAAERYRKRQRGSRASLGAQLEFEEQRKRQLEARLGLNLTLYLEFVRLLARRASELANGAELASLGSQSVGRVLGELDLADGERQQVAAAEQLASHLRVFEQIRATATPRARESRRKK